MENISKFFPSKINFLVRNQKFFHEQSLRIGQKLKKICKIIENLGLNRKCAKLFRKIEKKNFLPRIRKIFREQKYF